MTVTDPRAEAQQIAGPDHDVRVLEPAPPAVHDPPWFADDPLAGASSGRPVLSPVATVGDLTWDTWLSDHPDAAAWASRRWLGAFRRVGAVPRSLAATRRGLHDLATHVLAPARYRATGRIGLRWTLDGFGTPFFGRDEQVRVEGRDLVVVRRHTVQRHPLTSIGDAADLAYGSRPDLSWTHELELRDPPEPADPTAPLTVADDAVRFLADWFGLAWSVLEELRHDPASTEAGRVQLWPEHFDAAVEVLPGDRRASYGFSPGDDDDGEPYVYVSLWDADRARRDPTWDAVGFPGAVLPATELVAANDQRGTVLRWLRERRDRLTTS